MSNRRYEALRKGYRHLALVGTAATLVACGAGNNAFETQSDSMRQELATCSYTITTNTYDGPNYWGTIVFKNTGTSAMTSPKIAFNVPSGVVCDYDHEGWTHTQSGTTCTYSRTSSLTVGVNASYTFYYSTTSNSSFTATNVQISDPSCGTGGNDGGTDGGTGGSDGGMTANQKKVAEAITSIWENDTPVIDYAYSENIHDGRGYTNGRAGFCTGTGDAIQVIECYVNLRSASNGNLMAKYMPGLITINNRFLSTGQSQASTSELDVIGNWTADWAASYNNTTTRADFKSCQDQVNDRLYYSPMLATAKKWGLTTALTKAALYDAFINHGEYGAREFIRAANTALGNSGQVAPVIGYNGITESAWLQKFLEKRRDTLAADSTWIEAIDRVAIYEKLRRRGNWDLSTAVRNDVRARDCWGSSYPFSGYTVRQINPDGTWSTPSSYSYSCN
ncbi:chitosanase [Archangium violaceum]|uniref:chitosanase n=1 Tax=Archangium violaceum TaxID=83451 RepID=UPI00193B107B|nr:chitosanase [Archangium violaceum]QRK11398.1 chitosanase [Archangium violaceum]